MEISEAKVKAYKPHPSPRRLCLTHTPPPNARRQEESARHTSPREKGKFTQRFQ